MLCGRTARKRIALRPDDGEPIVVPGPVLTEPHAGTEPVDIVLLAVKTTQNDAAVGWLDRLCDKHTVVCVLQNGVEQVEQVGPHCPHSTVIPALVWFPAETMADGWVRLRGEARVVLPAGAAGETVAGLLRDARCVVGLEDDFTTAAWRKLLVNAAAGLMVLSGRRSGMFGRADVAALTRRYLDECLAVARADGAQLGDETIDEIVDLFARAPEDMGTSILADRQARRPLEWDIRNGVITRRAAAHGLPTPVSDVVVPLLAAASDGPG